jgi:beta-barrel assembly-enhancing protease
LYEVFFQLDIVFNMIRFLTLLIYLISFTFIHAQPWQDFSRLKCVGEMPDDFRSAFSDKYKTDILNNQSETDLNRKDAQEFAVLTNYYNHRLLTGGSVLYGDQVSSYANQILDKLLVELPNLRDQLRVYTIKSNHVNAYSTNQGIIYITLGLVGKVQNEAQLAYVLAHEISHYNNRHVLQSFENQKEIWAKGGSYRDLDVEEKTLTSYKYSREAEFEADKEALIYYQQAGYSTTEIYTGFDVLLHGYLPIAEKEYSWEKLENDSLKISDYYLIDSVAPIKDNDDVEDEMLTHPNIQKRKKAVEKELSENDSTSSGVNYVVKTEQQFTSIRNIVRLEMLNSFVRTGNYVSALYHIQVLEAEFGDHPFLKRMELMCWYGMQKMATNQQKKMYSRGYRKVEGEEQAVYYFASKMPKRGINILATKFIWEQTEGMVKDSFISNIRKQSVRHLSQTVKKDFLYEEYKVKSESKRKRKPKKIDFLKIAFVELFKNDDFKQAFNEAYGENSTDEDDSDDEYEESNERLADSYVPGVSSYYGLSDVSKLIFLSPKFYRIDLRKDLDQRLITSDHEEADLQERSNRLSKLAGIELVTLDEPNPEDKTTEAFNDYMFLRDWLREEALYGGIGFYSFSTQYLTDIRQKYDTDYLGLNYVSHFTERNQFNAGYLFLAGLTIYGLPFYVYWQVRPLHNLDYAFVVFDLKAGDVGFYDLKSFPARYKKGVINSHLYNSFNQLNRQR